MFSLYWDMSSGCENEKKKKKITFPHPFISLMVEDEKN